MLSKIKKSQALRTQLKPLTTAILSLIGVVSPAYSAVINYSDAAVNANGITLTDDLLQLQVTTGTAVQTGVIKGDFSFEKIGSGILVLSATNTYQGDTNISAGTLRLSNGTAISDTGGTVNVSSGATLDIASYETIGSISGAGNINLNNYALTTGGNNTSTTYSGVLSGTGSLTIVGTGKTTLSGTNTYSGNTINSGTISVSEDNNLGSGGALLFNGGTMLTTATFSSSRATTLYASGGTFNTDENTIFTQNGTINGSGTLTKTGKGTLVISEANYGYTGDTVVSEGTLRFMNVAINNAGNILNNATVESNHVDASVSDYYNDVISGTGSLIKTGAGRLILTNGNTYTGGTTISEGSLAVFTGGSIAGNVVNNASLEFRRGGNYLFGGDISGTGSVITAASTGTTTFTGNNTYSGTTTINNGTLQIGNSGTSGTLGTGNVSNSSALIFNRSDASSYAGAISGTGSVSQNGAGNFNLTGTNTYSGITTVNAGTLSINGSILNSATTVNSGGTLGGSGSIGDVTINSGGSFAPGNSIGTINVAGNVIFNPGSNYNVEVDAAGNTDKIISTGTATLTGSTVNVQPIAGSYSSSTDYTILTATGGFGGTAFSSVNSNLAFLTPTLSYDATNVFLNLTRNDASFSSVASTPNQMAVSTVIGNNTTALQSIVNNITALSDAAAQQAYDSLSGVQHTQNQVVINKLDQQFQRLLFNHSSQGASEFTTRKMSSMKSVQVADNSDSWQHYLTESLSTNQPHWWMQGLGGFGSIDSSANASGADYQSGGFAVGMDTTWHDYLVGFAGSYVHTNVDSFAGDSDVDSFQTGAFARWEENNIYINTSLGLGIHNVDATRTVTVGTSVNTATSDYDSVNLSAALESGKYIKLDETTTFTPYAGINYSHSTRDDFSERGADIANLNVNKQDEDSLRSALGFRLSRDLQTSNHTMITPALNLAYVREFLDDTAELEANFAGAPTANFKVDGSELDRNRLVMGVSLTGQLNEHTTLNIGYNGEIAGSDDHHSVAATIKFVM